MIMLIKNKTLFTKFAGVVSVHKSFESYSPSIEWAKDFHMVPLLGQKLYSKLAAIEVPAPEGSGSPAPASGSPALDPIVLQLLAKAQLTEALFAAFDFSQISDVQITSQGLQTISSDTHKSAYEYQKRDLQNYFASKADSATDSMLLYVEHNKAALATWSGDESLSPLSYELIIASADEFSKYCDIGNSRRTFLSLQFSMCDVIYLHVLPAIGELVYSGLVSKLSAGNPTDSRDVKLLSLLKPAIANLTLAEALPDLTVRFVGDSVFYTSFFAPPFKQQEIYNKHKIATADRRRIKGSSYLDAAVNFITGNAEYFAIEPIISDTTTFTLENDEDSKHFVSPFF